jgi:hypothetical protein
VIGATAGGGVYCAGIAGAPLGVEGKSGGVTGLVANGDVLSGGAANVPGGAAEGGCVANGYCATARLLKMSSDARPAMSGAERFTEVAAR